MGMGDELMRELGADILNSLPHCGPSRAGPTSAFSKFDIGSPRAVAWRPMSGTKVRLTAVIMDVLDVLTSSSPDDPAWGLRLCEQTGYGTGTVYPALDRLLRVGWIEDRWEKPAPADRPRRRYYFITSAGRAAYQEAIAARAARRTAWAPRALSTGGAA